MGVLLILLNTATNCSVGGPFESTRTNCGNMYLAGP